MSESRFAVLAGLLLAWATAGSAAAQTDLREPPQPLARQPAGEARAAAANESSSLPTGVENPNEPPGSLPGIGNLGGGPKAWTSPGGLSSSLRILLLLTVLSLAPAILLMTTCFVRVIVVLGLLRQALGTQQVPPSQVITAMALFMTLLVMAPGVEADLRPRHRAVHEPRDRAGARRTTAESRRSAAS